MAKEMLDRIINFFSTNDNQTVDTPTVDEFIRHALRRDTQFALNLSGASIKALINVAFEREPRLVATLQTLSTKQNGAFSEFDAVYNDIQPFRFNDIAVCRNSFTSSEWENLLRSMPEKLLVVANSPETMQASLTSYMNNNAGGLLERWETLGHSSLENKGGWACFTVNLKFNLKKYRRIEAEQEVRRIISKLHMRNLTERIQSFLALSYVAQTAVYDVDGGDDAYSALLGDHRACALGIAEAYSALLEAVGISSNVIRGTCLAVKGVNYAWVQLALGGEWYHADPSITLQGDELYLGAYLLGDSQMRSDYHWTEGKRCRALYLDAKRVLQEVSSSSSALLRMGVPEKYLLPKVME